MKERIKSRIEKGLKLTKAQTSWAANKIGKYEDDCEICFFNLCIS